MSASKQDASIAVGVRKLAGHSSLLVLGRAAGAGANFLFAVMLARILAPAEVGVVFASISLAFLASIVVTLNIESGSIRFLVAARQNGEEATARGFVQFGRKILLYAAPLVSLLYIIARVKGADAGQMVVVLSSAAAIPAIGWLRLSGSHATALGAPAAGSLPRTAVQPLLLIFAFVLALAGGAKASAGLALFCFLLSLIGAAILQFLLLRRRIHNSAETATQQEEWRDWLKNGFFMSPIMLFQDYLQHCIVLAAAIALPPEDVALLAVSIRFISLIRFGVLSINMTASPMIARAMAAKNDQERHEHLRSAALLKAPFALLAVFLVAVFSDAILRIFGPDYAGKGDALLLFTLIPLVSALIGPNYMLLNIAGARVYIFAASMAAVGCLFAFIPAGASFAGVTGAAAAAALVYVLWEFSLFFVVRSKLGIDGSFAAAFRKAP